MKVHKIIFSCIIFICNCTLAWTQDSTFIFVYPSAKEIDIVVKASVSLRENTYMYEYELTSLATSRQEVWTFDVFYEGNIKSLTAPIGWEGEAGRGVSRISWGASDSLSFISPSEILAGFSYESTGLPSITTFLSSGWVPPPVLESEPDSIVGDSIFENSKMGKTIGPKAPPDPFIPVAFLDTLISYKHQAYELGWIDNQGIVNSLDAKLDNAKKQLEKGKTNTAINILQAFVNEVEAQKDKHLTSEAYALLKYNAEYLIEKLSE